MKETTVRAGRSATASPPAEHGPAPVGRANPGVPDDRRFAALVCVCFAIVVGIMMLNHEMWRDEVQAWLLAAESSSIADLFHKRRAEGHPALWYLLLYPITRVTLDPAAMQALHLGIATAGVYVLARFAPFPRWQRVSLAAGYFLAYEYAVISRSYGVGTLALFATCALLPRRSRSYIGLALLLALLANTSAYGLVLAVAMTLALIIDGFIDARRGARLHGRRIIVSGVILASGMLLAALQLVRLDHSPPPQAFGDGPSLSLTWKSARTIATVYRAYIPIPDLTNDALWNTSLLLGGRTLPLALAALLAVGLLTIFAVRLWNRPAAFVMYMAGSAMLLGTSFMYLGGMRHYGHHFVLLIATLWSARTFCRVQLPRQFATLNRWSCTPARFVLSLVLMAQVAGAALLYAADLDRPFSTARRAADFLEEQDLRGVLLAAPVSALGIPVAGYLERPLYYMNLSDFGTYADWTRAGNPAVEGLRPMAALIGEGRYEEALIVSGRPVPDFLTSGSRDGWQFHEIARFEDALISSERYVVYRATLNTRGSAPVGQAP